MSRRLVLRPCRRSDPHVGTGKFLQTWVGRDLRNIKDASRECQLSHGLTASKGSRNRVDQVSDLWTPRKPPAAGSCNQLRLRRQVSDVRTSSRYWSRIEPRSRAANVSTLNMEGYSSGLRSSEANVDTQSVFRGLSTSALRLTLYHLLCTGCFAGSPLMPQCLCYELRGPLVSLVIHAGLGIDASPY